MIFGRLSSKRELAQKDKVDLGLIKPMSFAEKLGLINQYLYNVLK
jgi:hypothetical protein